MKDRCFLGIDLGSSLVKTNLLDADSGRSIAAAAVPATEMEIISHNPGWAEQHPIVWWENLRAATQQVLRDSGVAPSAISAIGISYQMHGLVVVDRNLQVLRPAIIWCDSRAVKTGEKAARQLPKWYRQDHLLNSPGNFTASKLGWVRENEPEVYVRIHKILLPGDYIALKLTGETTTTASGLSEGIMWDFKRQEPAEQLLRQFDIDRELLPTVVPTFGIQGRLTGSAAEELGLVAGTPVCYRAGDQPNNAFSLKAIHAGEVAATAGTSGVIYAVTNRPTSDELSRVNTFLHVNHSAEEDRMGVLLCVNGTGIMYRWLKNTLMGGRLSYEEMNDLSAKAPAGSAGLSVLPFGNGAERMLSNRDIGASFHGLDLVRHGTPHICRAVQEGIVFALGYGFEVLRQLGVEPRVIRAGHANLFQSKVFCETFAQVTGTELQLFNVDGAQGAARGAGVGVGYFENMEAAFKNVSLVACYEPGAKSKADCAAAYARWKDILQRQLETT